MRNMLYPKEVQKHLDILNEYTEVKHFINFDILHMYPGEMAYPNGYYDSCFFDAVLFNTVTMEKCVIPNRDGIQFLSTEKENVISGILIYADGSTVIVFKKLVTFDHLQCLFIRSF